MSSSRLIVKNLPKTATENKLKEVFSAKGTVTDVQLKFAEDGKFRGFAFIGFKTKDEADTARDYFDKTFIGATKIQVESCVGLGDRPKAWSKHAKVRDNTWDKEHRKREKVVDEEEEDVPKPKKKKRKEEEVLEKFKDDPQFREFLEIHRKDQAKWGNDTVLDELEKLSFASQKSAKNKDEMSMKKTKKGKKDSIGSDGVVKGDEDNELKDSEPKTVEDTTPGKKKKPEKVMPDKEFFTIKLRDIPKKAKKKDIKAFFAPLTINSVRMPPKIRGIAYVGFLNEKDQIKALTKNKSFLLGNQVGVKKFVSQTEVEKVVNQKKSKWVSQEEELEKGTESIQETGRIFVRNLAYTTTEDEIREQFEQFGPVTEVHLPIDKITRQIKGFAFVSFLLPEQAAKAFTALDGTVFQGRMLHLLPSKSKDELTADQMTAGSSYKKEKELKMRKAAGSSHNWNALFLGTNAVSEVAAARYGVSREQLLLDNNDQRDEFQASVAVRMALAETEIVSETKLFLENNGVCLDAFGSTDKKAERSKTTFLVKNLIANTTAEELREIFQKYGVISQIILPPAGITAIVVFEESAEARAAFKNLAYTKFKGMPLYLEWAPVGVFGLDDDGKRVKIKSNPVTETTKIEEGVKAKAVIEDANSKKSTTKEIQLPTGEVDDEPFDEDMVPEPDTTLFVKSLNWSTEEDVLKKHFSTAGRVYAVTVARKKDPKDPTKLLSQGYGFVQFYRGKDATKALERLHDSMLDNQFLEIKRSNRTLQTEKPGEGSKEKNGTKILVRNVPFQASDEEITNLFKVFGKLKGIRLPKKHVGESEHRGFAFVEFYSDKHAQVAFETLGKSTHLYGRRLVLEWAQGDESVEELREKVAKRYNLQRAGEKASDTTSTKKKMQRYFSAEASKPKRDEEEDEEDNEVV